MNVWKSFCRWMEGKPIMRHFGNMVPLLDRCALFEFTQQQIENAQKLRPSDLSKEGEHPLPPLPFPEMCLVGPGGVIVLRSPLMDDEDRILQFEMMVYQVSPLHEEFFHAATCLVDTGRLTPEGEFPMETRNMRGLWGHTYWDEEHPFGGLSGLSNIDVKVDTIVDEHSKSIADIEKSLEDARAKGDQKIVTRLSRVRTELLENLDKVKAAHERLAHVRGESESLLSDSTKTQRSSIEKAFHLGLQEITWINHPDHFTVEVAPSEPPSKRKDKTRIRRYHERPRHIILTKNEITEAWHRTHRGGTHASPIPHLRRGHYKTLRADRWKERKGQRIWVRASHVNGECVEWREGNTSYKVV